MTRNRKSVASITFGFLSALIVLAGGGALLVGGVGTTIVWMGDVLKPHGMTLLTLAYYGGAACGGGILILGTTAVIARLMQRRPATRRRLPKRTMTVPPACKGCRYYHGQWYSGQRGAHRLICCLHPYGWEGKNCPDYQRGRP